MTITKEDLQQLAELLREPAPQPKPKESFGIRLAAAALVIAVVAAVSLAGLNFFAPALLGMQAAPQVTALPTLPPRPTTPPYQPAQQYQQPTAAPQATAGAVIVVTPTYETGCHEGDPYVDGIPTNGACAGAAFAPEVATVQIFATAVPPDAVYMETIRNQAPHCIRCAP